MRELDRCDFCEEPADGVYEVVPDTVPSGARRLVLCTACRDTLAGVVDPLLDALDGHDHAEHDHSPAVTVEPAVPDVELDADETADDAADGDADAADGNPGRDVTTDGTVAATDSNPDATDGDADAANSDADAADGDETEVDGETDTGPDRPEGYAQLVRLLRNRPGAMTRAALADLADGAYDLSRAEVDAAVDAAVENGHLEETPEGVRTP
ncbi:hypothetical protein [Halarchaeum nitratireducens]|uniref:Uncharacterized protein n=1 Tax=Halarchaeum nitratireducens TaxID=489913 RepID=A0A830GA52_9EURY|nr:MULTISPECIES: hypothetical protein [Halarchaeum]MBP2250238.1 hypothetical protein [Halarchaeum solikamskense]GGN12223.1 hypothetical protein GCM10009021_10230 [Halarchaeum nitratireducens]